LKEFEPEPLRAGVTFGVGARDSAGAVPFGTT